MTHFACLSVHIMFCASLLIMLSSLFILNELCRNQNQWLVFELYDFCLSVLIINCKISKRSKSDPQMKVSQLRNLTEHLIMCTNIKFV